MSRTGRPCVGEEGSREGEVSASSSVAGEKVLEGLKRMKFWVRGERLAA